MNNRHRLYVCMIGLFLSYTAQAQKVDSCNVFLKGNYVELGVNWNGCYGSSVAPPAGYHPDTLSSFYNCFGTRTADTALGMVADPDKNGWNTGTPKYYGDYVLPGVHQEGWSVLADGVQTDEWNAHSHDSAALDNGMTIYDIEYYSNTSGDTITSLWAGTYGDYLQVTQFTVLDTSKLFFTVHIQIDNTGLGSSNNIYYMRTIKASGAALLSAGGYVTKNKIECQFPDSLDRSVVSSTSTTTPNDYIAMGSRNPNATAFIIKNSATPIFNTIDNISAESDANYLYNLNDSMSNEGGIGIVFNLGNITSGNFDTLSFVYAFSPDALREGLGLPPLPVDTTSTGGGHTGVNNVQGTNYVLYPNPINNSFSVRGLNNTDQVALYDEMGRNVTMQITNTGKNNFATNDLAAGLYVLLVKDNYGNVLWKTPLQKQ